MKNEIKVITKVDLLEIIFPGYWEDRLFLTLDYEATCQAVDKWAADNNYAIYEEGAENFSIDEGISIAKKNNNVGVLIDNLS